MIGAKLSDQRNSRNAGLFKFTNQRLAYRGSALRFSRRSNPPKRKKTKKTLKFARPRENYKPAFRPQHT